MKAEIERILEMHKTGTLSSDQAAELIRELGGSESEKSYEKSFTEKIMETVSKVSDHFHTFHNGSEGENSMVASKIISPRGERFSFTGNRFTTSHAQELIFVDSQFENNKTLNTHLESLSLKNSSYTASSFVNTHVKDIRVDRSEIKELNAGNTEIRGLSLRSESSIVHTKFQASSLHEISLEDDSEITDCDWNCIAIEDLKLQNGKIIESEFFGAKIKDVKFLQSSWMGVTIRKIKIKDVILDRSHFTETVLTADMKWKKSSLEDVRFENVFLKKVIFSNCTFQDVVFKNITQENLRLTDLKLKDAVIDGDEAFLKLAKG
jgi:uncharacterized protein YjbI with pentapeptide repeats